MAIAETFGFGFLRCSHVDTAREQAVTVLSLLHKFIKVDLGTYIGLKIGTALEHVEHEGRRKADTVMETVRNWG